MTTPHDHPEDAAQKADASAPASAPGVGAAILFTAFEPSADDHAAVVIRELKRRRPDLSIYAWGGPKMARAGAEIIAETGHDAVVGVPGMDKIIQHIRMNREISRWIKAHPEVEVHVPVDSPSANFPIAKAATKHGRKVVHLVAPQLWAWRPGRIKKLRKCTKLVLCVLPFEERYFEERGVPARFIGHPLFDEAIDLETLSERAEMLPQGSPKLALLPGSRPAEVRRNFPVMINAFRILREKYPGLVGTVAATTEAVRSDLYERARGIGGWPEGLDVRVGETDLVVRWADLALVVSGTVSLQVARQATPMVLMYKVNKIFYRALRTIIGFQAPYFTLPNLIAGQEVIPELIPYFKGPHRLVDAASRLLDSPERQEAQRLHQRMITGEFAGTMASHAAAQAILEIADVGSASVESPGTPSASADTAERTTAGA